MSERVRSILAVLMGVVGALIAFILLCLVFCAWVFSIKYFLLLLLLLIIVEFVFGWLADKISEGD